MMVYSKKYKRPYQYNLEHAKHTVFVYLTTEKQDWETRCRISHEAPINFEEDTKYFDEAIAELKEKLGDEFKILSFNVSHMSLFDIATEINKYMNEINKEN